MTAASDTRNIAGFLIMISGGVFLTFHIAVFLVYKSLSISIWSIAALASFN